jgi:hypothetical protein
MGGRGVRDHDGRRPEPGNCRSLGLRQDGPPPDRGLRLFPAAVARGFMFSRLALLTLLVSSCKGTGTPMPTTSTNVETDIDKLSQIVALPYRPVHATWQVLPMGDTGAGLGPNDWALVAAIHFEEADLEEIRAEAAGLPPMGDLHVQPEFVKDWFPWSHTLTEAAVRRLRCGNRLERRRDLMGIGC